MTDTTTPTTARLVVPELTQRPFIGSGCCAIAASQMMADSLGRIPGVRAVSCDDTAGIVGIEFDGDPGVTSAASSILESMGYPVTAVEA